MKIGERGFDVTIEMIIYDFFLKQFGLKHMAEEKLIQFVNSIKAH